MNPFIKKLGLLAAMLSAFLSASAYDFEVGGIYYNITDPTAKNVEVTYETAQYTASYNGDIVMPSSVPYNGERYAVTAIGSNAFYDCRNLTSITIPNSVTTIGSEAFFYCSSLTSITIPNSVTTIGISAFSYCSNLTSITIPNSVTSIGDGAFWLCSNLTSITIPSSVTAIGHNAFFGCSNLTNIYVDTDNKTYSSIGGVLYNKTQTTLICCPSGKAGDFIIPSSVTAIGGDAFSVCIRLTSITIPNSVTAIGERAFYDCSGLTSITIPNSVTTIGVGAFKACSSLTSFTIPNSVTAIENDTFYHCFSLTSITIPNSVITIGNSAFYGCKGLTSITIPNSVTTIWDYAFLYCSSLASITIPNSVTTIGWSAFSYCNSLTSITSLSVTPPECGNSAFDNINMQECVLYVPFGSIDVYKQALEWNKFEHIEGIALVAEIRLNETEVNMKETNTFQLTAEILPEDATNKTLLWESSDASCVTVDERGLLTAVAQGTATITVRSADGNAVATCLVKVLPTTGIESVSADGSAEVEVFNLAGLKVADTLENLPTGIYLVRQGSTMRKMVVK